MIYKLLLALLCVTFLGACAELESLSQKGGTQFGETSGTIQSDRNGTVTKVETIHVDKDYKLSVGTAAGAVAGAVLGGLAGTYAESKLGKETAQQVTVKMATGGTVTIVQPSDGRLKSGLVVRVEGSGENARVVPRNF